MRALEPWEHELDLLQTIPGIARSSAHAILAELGPEPTRGFPDAASLSASAGVCSGNNESAGKRRFGRVRAGNSALRVTLTECALGPAHPRLAVPRLPRNMKARIGHKRGALATAHQLLCVIHPILRDDHPYRDQESLLVKRNATRRLRMLSNTPTWTRRGQPPRAEPSRLQTTAQVRPLIVVGPKAPDRGCLWTAPTEGPSVRLLSQSKCATATGGLRAAKRVSHGNVRPAQTAAHGGPAGGDVSGSTLARSESSVGLCRRYTNHRSLTFTRLAYISLRKPRPH